MRKVYVGVFAAALGCIDADIDSRTSASRALSGDPACQTHLLPWGAGEAELGFVAAAPERAARGPMSVALRGSEAFVLDNVRARVARVDGEGRVRSFSEKIEASAEGIAVGADGTVAVFNPLHARVDVFDSDGSRIGDVPVPRALRKVSRIGVSSSRRVLVYSAFQEQHSLGSPAAPMALDSVLHSRLEGAYRIGTSQGVVAVADGDQVELRVLRSVRGERAQLSHSLTIPGTATAAQVVGGAGSVVCLRTEEVDKTQAVVDVKRRLVCADVDGGRWVLDRDLPSPGLYVPRQEISVSALGSKLSTVVARPTASGLELNRCEVSL